MTHFYTPLSTLTFVLGLFCHTLMYAQLTLRISNVPNNTPTNATIYVAGSFNAWNPSSTPLIHQSDGSYSVTINPTVGLLEYKFTRGSWNSVEGNANGSFLPNRTYNYTGSAATIDNLQIATWEDLVGSACVSTANNQVSIMATNFYMPQLDRYRRIWIYLPNDYNSSPDKHYPVIYMHDAQNLFDACGSFAGEWEIDETLHNLQNTGDYGSIVVGIDNGGSLRLDEYSPWLNPTHGGGDGDEYIDFIVQTLKPTIDANYRTLPNRQHTAIVGSSMGGLISFYAALQYQDIFGRAGIFSPSFWFSNAVFDFAANHPKQQPIRFYFLAGGLEGTQMTSDMQNMRSVLLSNGFSSDEINYNVIANGQHSEWFWAEEFGNAYTWLFSNNTLIEPIEIEQFARIYPTATDSAFKVDLLQNVQGASLRLYAPNGKMILNQALEKQNIIATPNLSKGIYFVQLIQNGITKYCTKLLIVP